MTGGVFLAVVDASGRDVGQFTGSLLVTRRHRKNSHLLLPNRRNWW